MKKRILGLIIIASLALFSVLVFSACPQQSRNIIGSWQLSRMEIDGMTIDGGHNFTPIRMVFEQNGEFYMVYELDHRQSLVGTFSILGTNMTMTTQIGCCEYCPPHFETETVRISFGVNSFSVSSEWPLIRFTFVRANDRPDRPNTPWQDGTINVEPPQNLRIEGDSLVWDQANYNFSGRAYIVELRRAGEANFEHIGWGDWWWYESPGFRLNETQFNEGINTFRVRRIIYSRNCWREFTSEYSYFDVNYEKRETLQAPNNLRIVQETHSWGNNLLFVWNYDNFDEISHFIITKKVNGNTISAERISKWGWWPDQNSFSMNTYNWQHFDAGQVKVYVQAFNNVAGEGNTVFSNSSPIAVFETQISFETRISDRRPDVALLQSTTLFRVDIGWGRHDGGNGAQIFVKAPNANDFVLRNTTSWGTSAQINLTNGISIIRVRALNNDNRTVFEDGVFVSYVIEDAYIFVEMANGQVVDWGVIEDEVVIGQ